MLRTTLLSRIAGIDLILERLDRQDVVAVKTLAQVEKTNSRVTGLEFEEVRRKEREKLAREASGAHTLAWRFRFGSICTVGGGAVGYVGHTLKLW